MRRRAPLVALFAFAAAAGASAANAQPKVSPSLDLRGFRASPDPAAGIYYEPASSPGHLEANGAAWLSYAYSPIVVRSEGGGVASRPVEHSFTGDFAVNVGLFGRAAFGLVLPYAIFQSGQIQGDAVRVLPGTQVPAQAVGDLAAVGKLTLIPPTSGDHGGFALALHERFTFPTGDESSYLGEGDVTSETRLLAEYTTRAFGFYATTGFKLRGSSERFACPPGSDAGTKDTCLTRVGHELPFGVSFRLLPRAFGVDEAGRWTTFAEIYGRLPLAPIDPFSPNRVTAVEAAIGARYTIMRDFSLLAGVATALVGGVGEPPFRGVVALGWAPRSHDADRDGIDDDIDQCRELAEDRDGFEDDDGCPEGDNDQDTVPDQADRCPNEKEDLDGFHDDDGCPDPDNDGDGIPDAEDACPNQAGPADTNAGSDARGYGSPSASSAPNPKRNGCPKRDQDGDGILDENDRCPTLAEDIDGFQDEDGCPDPDNDGDGIPDAEDTCPNVPGVRSADPKQNGCPEIDADGDTFWGAEDKCPLQAEDWNGKDDDDGCPDDPKRKPLVTLADVKGEPTLMITKGVRFTKEGEIEPESMSIVRAIGAELNKHPALGTKPAWSVAVGVRPSAKGGESEALLRAFTVVEALRKITRRDAIAETVGWAAVKDLPGASAAGVGFLLLTGAASADTKQVSTSEPETPVYAPQKPSPAPQKPAQKVATPKQPAPQKPAPAPQKAAPNKAPPPKKK